MRDMRDIRALREKLLEIDFIRATDSLNPVLAGYDEFGNAVYKIGEKDIFRLHREYSPSLVRLVIDYFHRAQDERLEELRL